MAGAETERPLHRGRRKQRRQPWGWR